MKRCSSLSDAELLGGSKFIRNKYVVWVELCFCMGSNRSSFHLRNNRSLRERLSGAQVTRVLA